MAAYHSPDFNYCHTLKLQRRKTMGYFPEVENDTQDIARHREVGDPCREGNLTAGKIPAYAKERAPERTLSFAYGGIY